MKDNIEEEPLEIDWLAADTLALAKSRIADPELASIVAEFIKREQERYIEVTQSMDSVPDSLKGVFIRKIQRILESPESLRGIK
jgi:hypothetical protein